MRHVMETEYMQDLSTAVAERVPAEHWCEHCRTDRASHTVICQYGSEHHFCDRPACRSMMAYTAAVVPS